MRLFWVILCGLGVVHLIPGVWMARCATNDHMGIGNPDNRNRRGNTTGRQVVATDYASSCCGVVDSWQFYVGRAGTVYLQIWRDVGGGSYTLVGQSSYTLAWSWYEETKTLSTAEQIQVLSGDVIGWYSDDQDIIAYKNGNDAGVYEVTNTLQAVGNTISQPSTAYSGNYGVRADLDPGNSPYFTNLDANITVTCSAAANGLLVYTVAAADADVSDVLTMTLDSVTPSSHLSFDAATGQVTVSTSSLSITNYTLTLSVDDGCSSTTNTLTVVVTNTVPYFSNLDGSTTILCTAAQGSSVFAVTATDDDGASDPVTVTLDSTTPSNHFAFDSASGNVTVDTSSLTIGVYVLTFTATDSCGQSSNNTLTVTVSDNDPYFTNLDGSTTIGCYTAQGSSVFIVTATDDDGASDTVTMTLDSITPSTHFAFDPATGSVTVYTSSLTIGVYVLTFTATDSCGQSSTNTLTVTVTDNNPYFSNLDAVITSLSNLALGTVLYTVISTDDDSSDGDSVTTSLDSTSPYDDFMFNATTGQVSVATTPLTIGDYTLTFTVTDFCGHTATNTLTVTVYNQVPVITSLPATVDVREDELSATLLHTVTVTDADGHTVNCVISSTSPASAPFSMKFLSNGTSLENAIYLDSNAGLDYSTTDQYTLTIDCNDGYDSDAEALYVYIVENGMPLVSNLQNQTTVSTASSISTEVFAVLAEDVEGDPLTFSLTCLTASPCPFVIYSTGSILLSSTLLGSATLAYELDITVSDSYSTTAAHRLTVFVSDLNTAPVLANLPQTVQVSEDATLGTSIFLLSVYDEDGDTSFTIDVVYTPTTGSTKFVIDDAALTVSLSTAQSLDYETQSEYTLNITASDGTETSSERVLTIQVADVNEAPVLGKTDHYISQDEGAAGTIFTVPNILVSDPDTGDILTFSLGGSSDPSCSIMSINSSTGLMGYETDFDVDDTSLTAYFSCPIKIEDTGGLAVTATVTVSIVDINDNQPSFATHSYVMSVTQSTVVGTSIANLSVIDDDVTSVNQRVSFTLTQSGSYFALSSDGEVTLVADVSSVAAGTTLTATVEVNNIGYSVSDTVTIQLVINSDDEDGFWDDGANIAWVTLACVLLVGVAAAAAYGWHKFNSGQCLNYSSGRSFKVQPADKNQRMTPRPREDYMRRRLNSPFSDTSRSLTPTDVHVTGRWDAWSSGGGTGWRP